MHVKLLAAASLTALAAALPGTSNLEPRRIAAPVLPAAAPPGWPANIPYPPGLHDLPIPIPGQQGVDVVRRDGVIREPKVDPNSYYRISCYEENFAHNSVLGATQFFAWDMTVKKCARYCRNYKYFGISEGTRCSCNNQITPGSYQEWGWGHCTLRCPGDLWETCGGFMEIEVYQFREKKKPSKSLTMTPSQTSSSSSSSSPPSSSSQTPWISYSYGPGSSSSSSSSSVPLPTWSLVPPSSSSSSSSSSTMSSSSSGTMSSSSSGTMSSSSSSTTSSSSSRTSSSSSSSSSKSTSSPVFSFSTSTKITLSLPPLPTSTSSSSSSPSSGPASSSSSSSSSSFSSSSSSSTTSSSSSSMTPPSSTSSSSSSSSSPSSSSSYSSSSTSSSSSSMKPPSNTSSSTQPLKTPTPYPTTSTQPTETAYVPYVPGFKCSTFKDQFDSTYPGAGQYSGQSPVQDSTAGVLYYAGFDYISDSFHQTLLPPPSLPNAIGTGSSIFGAEGAAIHGKNATTWFGLSTASMACGLNTGYFVGFVETCTFRFTGTRADGSVVSQDVRYDAAAEKRAYKACALDAGRFYALRKVDVEIVEASKPREQVMLLMDDVSYGACYMQ